MVKWIFILGCFFCLIINQSLYAFNSLASNAKAYRLLAGKIGGPGNIDGTGDRASLLNPSYMTVDSSGNIFVSESGNNLIRKITPAGVVTTFVGTAGVTGTADGTGTAAQLNFPKGMTIDSSDNIYLCDAGNNSIRKITPAGVVTTFAGSTSGTSGTTNGTGIGARFYGPSAITLDSNGDFYIADTNNRTIRKMTSAGVVTTFAGTAGSTGTADGTGTAARFNILTGLTIDSSDNIYAVDQSNHNIRKITPAGVVTTFAGSTLGASGSTNGTGTAARFSSPKDIAINSTGDFFVMEYSGYTLRKITSAGVVTTLAGTAGSNGYVDGTGSAARFYFSLGITIDQSGNLYVGDGGNNVIRKVTQAGVVTTFVGNSGFKGTTNGTGTVARFNDPQGAVVDSSGNVFVSDTANHVIRKVTPAGVVTTFVGGMGTSGTTDGTGTAARFNTPKGIAIDNIGNFYVADSGNHTIRKITSAGVVTTFAGTAGSSAGTDGTGSAARFSNPRYIAIDSTNNLFVTDNVGSVRKITPAGVVTTFAGLASSIGVVNGTGTAARFVTPAGIGVDSSDNLYVTDNGSTTVRKITPAAVVTTLAGNSSSSGSVDGTGTAARFNQPLGVAMDSFGNIYVTDSGNNSIRRITPAGVVKTVSGKVTVRGTSLGPTKSATLGMAKCITIRNNIMYLCVDGSILYAPKP